MNTIEDVPLDLLRTISHANKVLDWHENLSSDDIPPEWMWPFDDLLEEWFEDVKASHKAGSSEVDNRTVVPMMSNDLAKDRR